MNDQRPERSGRALHANRPGLISHHAYTPPPDMIATTQSESEADGGGLVTNYTSDISKGDSASRATTIDPHNVEKEEDYNVTGIELFSDLVIVVAIHIIACPLEDIGDVLDNMPWYLVRVFHLWLIWHAAMLSIHLR
jgi:hypothetical protein